MYDKAATVLRIETTINNPGGFIAEARRLTIVADSEGAPLGYELWEDRSTALRAFVHHMSGED